MLGLGLGLVAEELESGKIADGFQPGAGLNPPAPPPEESRASPAIGNPLNVLLAGFEAVRRAYDLGALTVARRQAGQLVPNEAGLCRFAANPTHPPPPPYPPPTPTPTLSDPFTNIANT